MIDNEIPKHRKKKQSSTSKSSTKYIKEKYGNTYDHGR